MRGERPRRRIRELTLTLREQSFALLFPLPIIDSEIICLVICPLINLTTHQRRDWLCSPACEMGHLRAARGAGISMNNCYIYMWKNSSVLPRMLKDKKSE